MKHLNYKLHISFNKFTNTLNNTISESDLNSKLDSKYICYLFVNDGIPSAFINGKLLSLVRLGSNIKYSIAQVYLEVLQELRGLKRGDKTISLEIKSIVLYESMIDNKDYIRPIYNKLSKSHNSNASSHIYEQPVFGSKKSTSEHISNTYMDVLGISTENSGSSNENSAYGSRPDSPTSSFKRAKSKKSLRRKSQPTVV